MKTKCYSVRLSALIDISEKCYKAVAFDGSFALIPKTFVFGRDFEVQKSESYWIAAWILERRNLQYSSKKVAWFDEDQNQVPSYSVTRHRPASVAPKSNNEIKDLSR